MRLVGVVKGRHINVSVPVFTYELINKITSKHNIMEDSHEKVKIKIENPDDDDFESKDGSMDGSETDERNTNSLILYERMCEIG